MELSEAILNRRSIRKYSNKAIPDNVLVGILEAGLAAPSGINLQPWYFVALKSEDSKQEYLKIMESVNAYVTPELEKRFSSSSPQTIKDTQKFLLSMGNAPVILLVFLYKDEYEDKQTAIMGTAAATQNILLAAYDKGIGTCWLTAPIQAGYGAKMRDMFAPGKGELVSVVTLGYPVESPKMPSRREGRYIIN